MALKIESLDVGTSTLRSCSFPEHLCPAYPYVH